MVSSELKEKVKGKACFISGPMSGIEHFNVSAFAEAHAILKECGAKRIYDPAILWLQERNDVSEQMTHEDYMAKCLHELTRDSYMGERAYDVLVQIDSWHQSDGAWREYLVATCCGIECLELAYYQQDERGAQQ